MTKPLPTIRRGKILSPSTAFKFGPIRPDPREEEQGGWGGDVTNVNQTNVNRSNAFVSQSPLVHASISMTVNTTPTMIMGSSYRRRYLLVQNTGVEPIFIGFGSPPGPSGSNAIVINPGFVYETPAFMAPTNEVYASTGSGSSVVNIVEGLTV